MTANRTRRPFSMIREFHLADWFTLANAVCGTGALFSTITFIETSDTRHIYFACGLVFAALIFDVLDGRIASGGRRRQRWGESSTLWLMSFPLAWPRRSLDMAVGCRVCTTASSSPISSPAECPAFARYNVTADALSAGSDR